MSDERRLMLDAYLRAWAARPFDWRRANCSHFVGEWVEQVLGIDVLEGVNFPRSRHDAMRRYGTRLADEVADRLGEPILPAESKNGDVLLLNSCGRVGALGIRTGAFATTLAEGGGLMHVPMSYALVAWRV